MQQHKNKCSSCLITGVPSSLDVLVMFRSQLIIKLQARIGNYWSALTYSLLPNEESETIRTAFRQVREAVENHGLGFSFNTEVMFDFDQHMRKVYKEEIGEKYKHKLRGCSFHFGQCICNYVNGKHFMEKYKDTDNTILRSTIRAALGIPYLREEDIDNVQEELHSIFDHIEEKDPETYKFLTEFVDEYVQGYWINNFEKSEISFWGDLSHFSSEHMTNNAIESWNNEFYTLLGRKAHPNPYFFASTIKKALDINKWILGLVDKGDYLEVKSRTAKCAINKRNRLKLQYIQSLGVAQNEEMRRKARLKYMITTGSTNTRIMAKGKKKMAREKKEEIPMNEKEDVPKGRPSHQRVRAPESKKCRFCGKVLKSRSGAKNHERVCKKRTISEDKLKCRYCSRPYKVKFYLTQHEKKCRVNVSEEDSSEEESLSESMLLSEEESFNEEMEDDLFSESNQSGIADEVEVEVTEEENAVDKLKRISTELLYTDEESSMGSLLDQLEEFGANIEDMEKSGAGFILRNLTQCTSGYVGLRITKMYQELIQKGMVQEKMSNEYSGQSESCSKDQDDSRRKSKRLRGL